VTQRLSYQAVALCRSDEFQRYIERRKHLVWGTCGEDTAAEWLREQCGITSRGQLDTDPECARKFEVVRSAYRQSLASPA
jgi:hypothetical protein